MDCIYPGKEDIDGVQSASVDTFSSLLSSMFQEIDNPLLPVQVVSSSTALLLKMVSRVSNSDFETLLMLIESLELLSKSCEWGPEYVKVWHTEASLSGFVGLARELNNKMGGGGDHTPREEIDHLERYEHFSKLLLRLVCNGMKLDDLDETVVGEGGDAASKDTPQKDKEKAKMRPQIRDMIYLITTTSHVTIAPSTKCKKLASTMALRDYIHRTWDHSTAALLCKEKTTVATILDSLSYSLTEIAGKEWGQVEELDWSIASDLVLVLQLLLCLNQKEGGGCPESSVSHMIRTILYKQIFCCKHISSIDDIASRSDHEVAGSLCTFITDSLDLAFHIHSSSPPTREEVTALLCLFNRFMDTKSTILDSEATVRVIAMLSMSMNMISEDVSEVMMSAAVASVCQHMSSSVNKPVELLIDLKTLLRLVETNSFVVKVLTRCRVTDTCDDILQAYGDSEEMVSKCNLLVSLVLSECNDSLQNDADDDDDPHDELGEHGGRRVSGRDEYLIRCIADVKTVHPDLSPDKIAAVIRREFTEGYMEHSDKKLSCDGDAVEDCIEKYDHLIERIIKINRDSKSKLAAKALNKYL